MTATRCPHDAPISSCESLITPDRFPTPLPAADRPEGLTSPSCQQLQEMLLVPALQRRIDQVLRHSLQLGQPDRQGRRHRHRLGTPAPVTHSHPTPRQGFAPHDSARRRFPPTTPVRSTPGESPPPSNPETPGLPAPGAASRAPRRRSSNRDEAPPAGSAPARPAPPPALPESPMTRRLRACRGARPWCCLPPAPRPAERPCPPRCRCPGVWSARDAGTVSGRPA